MDTKTPYKEYFIDAYPGGASTYHDTREQAEFASLGHEPVIHVVEKSALDEAEKLYEELWTLTHEEMLRMSKEIERLRDPAKCTCGSCAKYCPKHLEPYPRFGPDLNSDSEGIWFEFVDEP